MISPNIRLRVDGVELRSGSPVQIGLEGWGALGISRSDVSDHIRLKFTALMQADAKQGIANSLAGKPVRIGMALPGEASVFFTADPALQEELDIGCAMRVITSSLLHDHIAAGCCSLKSSVGELLGVESVQGSPAAEILVEDLLNHRHGLEDSGIWASDFTRNGLLDEQVLWSSLNRNNARIPPGQRYSYSKAGFWLIGAILQRLERKSFAELVASNGFRTYGDVCPAVGGDCRIAGPELLKLLSKRLQRAKEGKCCAPALPDDGNVTALPGVAMFETGVQYGWKVYSHGWLGHNAQLRGETGVIRVHPQTGAALVLWAPNPVVASVVPQLFGNILPEGVAPIIPRRLRADEWARVDRNQYVGEFGAEGKKLCISAADERGLSATIDRGETARERFEEFRLSPAENNVFLPMPRVSFQFPIVQFLFAGSGQIDAVWNGRTVWPRI